MKVELKVRYNDRYAGSIKKYENGEKLYEEAIKKFTKEKKNLHLLESPLGYLEDDIVQNEDLILGDIKYMDETKVVVQLRGSHPDSKVVYKSAKLKMKAYTKDLDFSAIYVPKITQLKDGKIKCEIVGVALLVKVGTLEF